MRASDIYLLCFAVGVLWAGASLLLGGMHLGHFGHAHGGHGAAGHHGGHVTQGIGSWLGAMASPSGLAVFLAWFGGVGYLLTRHSGLAFWVDLAFALAIGLGGAWCLAAFLRFLQAREEPMDPADYRLTGVLGRVSSPIRAGGIGELMYVKDSARRHLPAASEDGQALSRGEEVVVTRYEKGIAYVRTWEAMTQPAIQQAPEALQKENEHVE